MSDPRNNQNPDVNSFEVDNDYGGGADDSRDPNSTEDAPEHDAGRERIPVPPDVEETYPIEDPPLSDVDNSPTRIASE